jgi:hypothetical protein
MSLLKRNRSPGGGCGDRIKSGEAGQLRSGQYATRAQVSNVATIGPDDLVVALVADVVAARLFLRGRLA